jgi:hypothetical protein
MARRSVVNELAVNSACFRSGQLMVRVAPGGQLPKLPKKWILAVGLAGLIVLVSPDYRKMAKVVQDVYSITQIPQT